MAGDNLIVQGFTGLIWQTYILSVLVADSVHLLVGEGRGGHMNCRSLNAPESPKS